MRDMTFGHNYVSAPPAGSAGHLPINGEDHAMSAPPAGSAGHLPINGEDILRRHLPINGEDILRRHLPINGEDTSQQVGRKNA
jgi:hypothetical protein